MRRLATGGPLNELNELCGCNSRARTVPVMALLDAHPTDDATELRRLIEEHARAECACGVASQGPVEKFALGLFEAQFSAAGTRWRERHRRYTYDECLRFHVALFCEAPIRGRRFELRSRAAVEAAADGALRTRRATPNEDGGMGVDYVVVRDGRDALGVQVKPASVLHRPDVLSINRQKHSRCPYPVVFHVYDDDGTFRDTAAVVTRATADATADAPGEA